MGLFEEIEKKRTEIKTDGYPMSIGEIMNLYLDGDITIFPEYQRYFRWNITQKSQLIESILLGIPIPAIFVAQDEHGKWDVIDGLQRICTIFEFAGILQDREGALYDPSILIGTKFLPSLEGKYWDNSNDEDNSLTDSERRFIKRSKINLMIIDSTSDSTTKYELFQRLNTNGAELSAQEIRNCLIVMIDKEFYRKIEELSQGTAFKNITDLTEKQLSEQYDKDLIARLIVARNINLNTVNSNIEIDNFVTENIVELIESSSFDFCKEIEALDKTFKLLDNLMGKDIFKKFSKDKGIFEGAFSLSVYEVLALGISENIGSVEEMSKSDFIEKVKAIQGDERFEEGAKRGKRAILRYRDLTNLSRELFKGEN